jgi:hypothetical protein
MRIAFAALMLFGMLIAASCSQEWPDAGDGTGGYGEVEQHFTDTILDSAEEDAATDATAQRGNTTDEQSEASRSVKPAAELRSTTPSTVPASAAGSWRLELTDGTSLDLVLHQSGSAVFGNGSVTKGSNIQAATAGGAISGPILNLDVIPVTGEELYTISLDFTALPSTGTYNLFRIGSAPISGIAKAA